MDLLTLILISGVMMLIGGGLGYMLAMLRTSPESTSQSSETASQAGKDRVLTLWRDRDSSAISVQINGQIIASQFDLTSDSREQLALRFELLQNWLEEGKQQPERSEKSISTQSSVAGHVSGAAPVQAASLVPKTGAKQERDGGINPVAVFTRALTTEVRKPQPVQSLAAQIDAILQERLEGSSLSTRGIRLQDHPQQGLIVQVGLRKYNSIDEVPEQEIRDFIRQAIAEWEKQAGSG